MRLFCQRLVRNMPINSGNATVKNGLPDIVCQFISPPVRVLRPGRRALFTDPVVVSGPITNDELASRSSIGLFLFVPAGYNERLVEQAGFRLVLTEDVTANAALVSGRWHRSRQAHREAVIPIEGQDRFEGLQRFFDAVHRLTSERRLSRIAYVVEKTG